MNTLILLLIAVGVGYWTYRTFQIQAAVESASIGDFSVKFLTQSVKLKFTVDALGDQWLVQCSDGSVAHVTGPRTLGYNHDPVIHSVLSLHLRHYHKTLVGWQHLEQRTYKGVYHGHITYHGLDSQGLPVVSTGYHPDHFGERKPLMLRR